MVWRGVTRPGDLLGTERVVTFPEWDKWATRDPDFVSWEHMSDEAPLFIVLRLSRVRRVGGLSEQGCAGLADRASRGADGGASGNKTGDRSERLAAERTVAIGRPSYSGALGFAYCDQRSAERNCGASYRDGGATLAVAGSSFANGCATYSYASASHANVVF
jgi:hypothetical protein